MGKKISKEEESNQKSMKKKKSALRKALKFVAGTGVCVGAGALLGAAPAQARCWELRITSICSP